MLNTRADEETYWILRLDWRDLTMMEMLPDFTFPLDEPLTGRKALMPDAVDFMGYQLCSFELITKQISTAPLHTYYYCRSEHTHCARSYIGPTEPVSIYLTLHSLWHYTY